MDDCFETVIVQQMYLQEHGVSFLYSENIAPFERIQLYNMYLDLDEQKEHAREQELNKK